MNRYSKLMSHRKKLKSMLSSGKGSKNEIQKVQTTLNKVESELRRLNKMHEGVKGHNQEDRRTVDINTIGGLQFQASSPPGIGRLVSLPFYPVNACDDLITASGAGKPSSSNPVCILKIGNTIPNAVSQFVMQSPQISWAKLRVVGFEVDIRTNSAQNASPPTLIVSDLKIGGGTNLFTHEDFSDGMFYSNKNDYYAGLRDYPLLISPNQANVSVSAVSPTAAGDTITFSAQLVCEVLSDENYGTHIPGPYARGASMVRAKGVMK